MRHERHGVKSLHEIGLAHGTDKATYHDYTLLYGELLAGFRSEPCNILELGWGGYGGSLGPGGESARMWVEAFPEAQVFVIDNDPGPGKVPDRCELIVGDQSNADVIDTLAARCGGFDVVVDDASHIGRLSRGSFEIIWPHVRPGGWYFIEDLFTSYMSEFEGHSGDTAVDLLKSLVDVAQADGVHALKRPDLLGAVEPIGIDRLVISGHLAALRKIL